MGAKVVCTCPECLVHWVDVDGQQIPGRKISSQQRRLHEISAAANRSPDFPSKPIPVGSKNLDEDDDKDEIGTLMGPRDIVIDKILIIQLCSALVVWLNLKAGVSCETANAILEALQVILTTTLELVQLALIAHGIPLQLLKFQLPQDIRTAYRNYTKEPEIIQTPCCPKCYTLYPSLENMPDRCTAKVSKKSRISCKAELWRTQRLGKKYKRVPKTTFNTQKFESWLEWFLSRKSIEDYLAQTFQRPSAADNEDMCDLQDSPRWKYFKNMGKDKYNLVFGLYIDWFNPRGNRIADHAASREAGGFLQHNTTMFCSYCLLTRDDRHRSDSWAWPSRVAAVVYQQARKWLKQPTKGKRIEQERKTGVRWCSPHLLSYRDPVKDTILGFMHNWLEGRDARRTKSLAELDEDDEDLWTDDEISDAGGETETQEVLDDAQNFDPTEFEKWRDEYIRVTHSDSEEEDDSSTPRGTPAPDSDDPMDGSTSDATPVPESMPPNETDLDAVDEEYEDVAVRGSWKFTKEQLQKIHSCIKEVSLPTWVSRPPGNLGEKKHGKLKAEEFLTLFIYIFPLVLPEMKFDDDPMRHKAMFRSFCDLAGATNILASFKTANSEAESFMNFYRRYFISIQDLFPDISSKDWGPLTSQNEFMGERINGMLQKIKTNDHMYDMDYTMLRQIVHLGRLLARQHDKNWHDEEHAALHALDNVLEPEDRKLEKSQELNEAELAQFLANQDHEIPVHVYNLVLKYLASVGEHKINFWGTQCLR
ncbi:hypothetical protein C8R45DRAFT_933026 [Mycena sanguinolenta]|nr:hypothetical protein C8R45DRAFT_933026 [Mycena sanguinolenta]